MCVFVFVHVSCLWGIYCISWKVTAASSPGLEMGIYPEWSPALWTPTATQSQSEEDIHNTHALLIDNRRLGWHKTVESIKERTERRDDNEVSSALVFPGVWKCGKWKED